MILGSVLAEHCGEFPRFVVVTIDIILDSSMVEHSAVNRRVVGSSPTRGAIDIYKAPWSRG